MKLKYLNIPHFNPIKLNTIKQMFYNLSYLIYLNIYSLEINVDSDITLTSSFAGLPPSLKICAIKNNMKTYLSSLNLTNNCSDICFTSNIKLDIENNECIISCKDNGFRYEYKDICYT